MVVTPCVHDSLTVKLIQRSNKFDACFISGFGIAASEGVPDAGLLSFHEVLSSSQKIIRASKHQYPGSKRNERSLPIICDIDTGYGNEMNVKRTVQQFIEIGAAAVMLEDQKNPKRCGHTKRKEVVDRDSAKARIQAAVQARNESETNKELIIIARTDARAEFGLDEALYRAEQFHELGADITFIEAPTSVKEMETIGKRTNVGYKMANLLLGKKQTNKMHYFTMKLIFR